MRDNEGTMFQQAGQNQLRVPVHTQICIFHSQPFFFPNKQTAFAMPQPNKQGMTPHLIFHVTHPLP